MFGTSRKLLGIQRFKQDDTGATAVEFALLALPFCVLLFAIVELALVFFLGSSVNHAMSEAGRQIRTGNFQKGCPSDPNVDDDVELSGNFKNLVCSEMSMGNCIAKMRVDVATSSSGDFEPNLLPQTPSDNPDDPSQPKINPDTYADSGPGDVVVVRAQYYHKLAMAGNLTRLSNQPGNYRVITAATAFRNEPFPKQECS